MWTAPAMYWSATLAQVGCRRVTGATMRSRPTEGGRRASYTGLLRTLEAVVNVSGMDAAATFVIHVIAWGGVAGILVGLIDRVRRRLPSWRNGVMVSPAHTRRRRSFAGIFIPLYGGVMAFMSWGVIQQARDA